MSNVCQPGRAGQSGCGSGGRTAHRKASESGTALKRSTRYPARLSIASRSSSLSFFVACEESSSSITAMTSNAREHRTKSATFLLNLLRVARPRVSRRAEKATWASTISSGKVSRSRKYIGCSRRVSGVRARIGDALASGVRFVANTMTSAAISTTRAMVVVLMAADSARGEEVAA